MSDPQAIKPHLILPTGTQVVALVEVRGTDGKPVHPRGAVGVVVQAPSDYWHVAFQRGEYERLVGELERASAASSLPEAATARPELHDLLVRLRMKTCSA